MDLNTLNELPPWEWPENASDFIFQVVSDKNASQADRALAAELAGSDPNLHDNLALCLISVTEDKEEPDELRGRTAIALGPALEYGDLMEFNGFDDDMLSEKMFHEVQKRFHALYQDNSTPKYVRRKILEASVRAPADWHNKAIEEAYSKDDDEWILTAVFCMGHVKGFDDQIIESLNSQNPDIFYEAICAAGNWGIKEAWPQVKELITNPDTDKAFMIAAIEAAAGVNPQEAREILLDLCDHNDEDIAFAANESLDMLGMMEDDRFNDDFLDDDFH
jgi:hypothetical protein